RHHCETAPEASRIRTVTTQGRFPGSRFSGILAFPGTSPVAFKEAFALTVAGAATVGAIAPFRIPFSPRPLLRGTLSRRRGLATLPDVVNRCFGYCHDN